MTNRTILHGDVMEKVKEIPDESIDCIISSPPYWGLRDYGVEGQWGLEPDFKDYLKKMYSLMDELKRVLKKTGTCWINLGDTYNGTGDHTDMSDESFGKQNLNKGNDYVKNSAKNDKSIQRKSRYGIPERFYIYCIDSGWLARNHIPWYKSNSMPSSVKDRFTNKWESIFFFTKSQKYYFDLDPVREKTVTETKPFNVRVRDAKNGTLDQKYGNKQKATLEEIEKYDDDHVFKKLRNKQDSTLGVDGKPLGNYKGFNKRWKERKWGPDMGTIASKHSGNFDVDGNNLNNPKGKNPGDVFFINPKPFPEAHFATFPVDLPLKILKCACPQDGIVLDPFFGSGTVGVAAEQLGRRWIGIEVKSEYIKIANKRLDKYKNESLVGFT